MSDDPASGPDLAARIKKALVDWRMDDNAEGGIVDVIRSTLATSPELREIRSALDLLICYGRNYDTVRDGKSALAKLDALMGRKP